MPIMSMGECLKAAHYIPEICEIISEKVDGEIGCSECSNSQSSFQNLTSQKKFASNQPCLSDSISVLMLFDESISICYTGGQLAFS